MSIKVLCVSKALVAPDVGSWTHEILNYTDEEWVDALGDDYRRRIEEGEIVVKENWAKEWLCHYVIIGSDEEGHKLAVQIKENY